jgi:hypothetical protein
MTRSIEVRAHLARAVCRCRMLGRMRLAVLAGSCLMALVLVSSASAAVRKVSFTGTVNAGDQASLTVTVAPRARCTIRVVYDTVTSRARGLVAKTGTRITWQWRVGTNTNPGRWAVTVDCGRSGKLALRIRVLPS